MRLPATLALGTSALPLLFTAALPVPMLSLKSMLPSGAGVRSHGLGLSRSSRDIESVDTLAGRKIKPVLYGSVHNLHASPPLPVSPFASKTPWKTEQARLEDRNKLLSGPLDKSNLEYYHLNYDLWKSGKLWEGTKKYPQ